MNAKHLTLSVVVTAASLWTFNAIGEQTQFSKLDTNGDGLISMDEATAAPVLIDEWESVDRNQDGKVEPAEFEALVKRKREANS